MEMLMEWTGWNEVIPTNSLFDKSYAVDVLDL